MSENKTLEQRVKCLEQEKDGMEMALQNLIVAICATGNINIPSVAKNYAELTEAILKTYDFTGSAAPGPMTRLQNLLTVHAEVIESGLKK